jgi:hypothetical protein
MLGGYQKQGKPLKVLKGLLGFIPTIFKIWTINVWYMTTIFKNKF